MAKFGKKGGVEPDWEGSKVNLGETGGGGPRLGPVGHGKHENDGQNRPKTTKIDKIKMLGKIFTPPIDRKILVRDPSPLFFDPFRPDFGPKWGSPTNSSSAKSD